MQQNLKKANSLISIIVPVYKVEKYIRQCLDSIEAQTFKDWECILVDDGSPDDSGKICDEYAVKDYRFRVIHQENKGVSESRNIAIQAINPESRYVSFIDPDDWVESEFLEELYRLIISYDADVSQVQLDLLYKNNSIIEYPLEKEIVLNRKEFIREIVNDKIVKSYLCNKLFKKGIISEKFPKRDTYEDMFGISNWAKYFHKVVLSPKVLYHYRQRKGSALHLDYTCVNADYLKVRIKRDEILNNLESSALKNYNLSKFYWESAINSSKVIARSEKDINLRKSSIKEISEIIKSQTPPTLKLLGMKNFIRALLLLYKPQFFIKLMRSTYFGKSEYDKLDNNLFE